MSWQLNQVQVHAVSSDPNSDSDKETEIGRKDFGNVELKLAG
jgi:hypothetical protein